MIHKLTLAALDQENSQQSKKGIMNLRSNHWLVIKSSRSTGLKQTETRKNLQNGCDIRLFYHLIISGKKSNWAFKTKLYYI